MSANPRVEVLPTPDLIRVLVLARVGAFGFVLLHAIRRHFSDPAAIIIQDFPYFLLHAVKPEAELWSSWPGGLLMGWFAQSSSFSSSV